MLKTLSKLRKMHFKCRGTRYPRSDVNRLPVSDNQVSWDYDWPTYRPPIYTDPRIKGQVWADHEMSQSFEPKWNKIDQNVNRVSHTGDYQVVDKLPLNPCGRTGLAGRGCLGRWGPNHAADPIVTRWKRSADGAIIKNLTTCKPILQFVGIKRQDCGEWAVPGGMVDPGERVTATLKREFMEEALNSLELKQGEDAKSLVDAIFANGSEIFRGYVDDPRNTDNAWMETVAFNYHDEEGTTAGRLHLLAGDDAAAVMWINIDSSLLLYASHKEFISSVAERLKAHW